MGLFLTYPSVRRRLHASPFGVWILVLALVVVFGSPVISSAADDGDKPSVCVQTATRLLGACQSETQDNYKVTTANCLNISDQSERDACREAAKVAQQEDRELCDAQKDARVEVCELLGEKRYDPDPLKDNSIAFLDDPDDSNPYFNLKPGHTYVVRGGEGFEETIVVHVTDKVRQIQGRNCRLVVDIVVLWDGTNYVEVEVTDDYYAQSVTGDVYYCGETARNFEDGLLMDLDGSFEAGRDSAKAGILIKAEPQTGDVHRQEWKLGDAEDVVRYVAGADELTSVGNGEGGENSNNDLSCAPGGGRCVKTEEFNPLEPEAGEFKYFLAGTGFVLGVAFEDGNPTGERDELRCVGDSLEILSDPTCDLDDLDKLRFKLCELSPVVCP